MGSDRERDAVVRWRVLRGTVSNYLGRLVVLGTGFLLTPFILSQLGQTTYGLWVLVGSLVTYGSLLDFGFSGAVIKYVAEYRARGELDRARSLVATVLCFYSALGLVFSIASVALAPVIPQIFNLPPEERETATWLVVLMGTGLGLSLPCITSGAVLRGLQRYDIVNLLIVVSTVISTIGTVALLLLGAGVLGLVALNNLIILAMQAPSVWCVHRLAPELRFGWRGARWDQVRKVVSFSSSIFAVQLGGRLQSKTDELVIGALMPIVAVTPYALARRLSELPQLLTDQLLKVLLPLASELDAERDTRRLRLLFLAGTRLTLVLFLPMGCGLMLLAGPALAAWVGRGYEGYAPLVVILTLAALIDTSQWPAASILQGMARHHPLAFAALGSGIANLALSIALLPTFGLVGVALGTLIPTAVEAFGFILPYTLRHTKVSLRQYLGEVVMPAVMPAVPMIVLLHVMIRALEPTSLLMLALIAGTGVGIYGLGYLALGATRDEREFVRRLVTGAWRAARTRVSRS